MDQSQGQRKKSLDQSWKIILEPEARLSLMYISTGYISVMILPQNPKTPKLNLK